jgi:WhiB family transcriptional regulator, redox-sensing transcriptional regulator
MTDYATDWRAAGACLAADPDLFYPIAVGDAARTQVARALRICGDCQVRQQCLDFALRTGESHGIWGGTTPEDRVRTRRARTRRASSRRPLAYQRAADARAS